MSESFRHQILNHLGHNGYQPVRSRELERQMRILEDQTPDFRVTLDALATEDLIDISNEDIVRLTRFKDETIGRIRINARGKGDGYLIPDVQAAKAISLSRKATRVAQFLATAFASP